MGLFGFFMMFVMWINFSLHYPMEAFLADICNEVQAVQDNQTDSDNALGILNKVINCRVTESLRIFWSHRACPIFSRSGMIAKKPLIYPSIKDATPWMSTAIWWYPDGYFPDSLKLPGPGEKITNNGDTRPVSCPGFSRQNCSGSTLSQYQNNVKL